MAVLAAVMSALRRLAACAAAGPLTAVLVALLCFTAGRPSATTLEQLNEYEVKAAFLYNFTKFVDWPPKAFSDPQAPIVVGLFGSDPFSGSLKTIIDGRPVNGRPIQVKVVRSYDDVPGCHILFVGVQDERRVPDLLRTIANASVLTVGESNGFAEAGGVVNFVVDAGRVRLEINLRSADRAGLRLSSKMLSVARIVDKRPKGDR